MLKVAYNSNYVLPLPEGHRFPMEKYELLKDQLLHEGTISDENLFSPEEGTRALAELVHSIEYLDKFTGLKLNKQEERATGFKQSRELVAREFTIIEGARNCAQYALENGVAMNIAGGTHHAYVDRGEGFCLMNDHAVAAKWLLSERLAKQVLIVDLDVHQGNGTAKIFEDCDDVYTFSMHGKHNYPLRKEKSSLDVEMEDGIGDQPYLASLRKHLDKVLNEFQPDFLIYQSGVDVLASDKLGRLNLSLKGCKERDQIVFSTAKMNNIPTICSMGGGYSPDIKTIIEAHANTFRIVQNEFF